MYSIGEVSKLMNLSVPTLRYYDDEGLLIDIKRDSNDRRVFDDKDINTLILINCLKNTGMKIKEIKKFMDLCLLGNESLKERLTFFENQEQVINSEIERLNHTMELIKFKKWYYETAIEHNDENYVKNLKLDDMPEDMRKLYKNTHHTN